VLIEKPCRLARVAATRSTPQPLYRRAYTGPEPGLQAQIPKVMIFRRKRHEETRYQLVKLIVRVPCVTSGA